MQRTPKPTRTPSRSQFRSKKVSVKVEETKKRTTRFLHTRSATSSRLPTLAAKTLWVGSSRAAGARRCRRSRQAGLALRSSSHRAHRDVLEGALAASSSPSWTAAGVPACPPAGCPSILTTSTPGVPLPSSSSGGAPRQARHLALRPTAASASMGCSRLAPHAAHFRPLILQDAVPSSIYGEAPATGSASPYLRVEQLYNTQTALY